MKTFIVRIQQKRFQDRVVGQEERIDKRHGAQSHDARFRAYEHAFVVKLALFDKPQLIIDIESRQIR